MLLCFSPCFSQKKDPKTLGFQPKRSKPGGKTHGIPLIGGGCISLQIPLRMIRPPSPWRTTAVNLHHRQRRRQVQSSWGVFNKTLPLNRHPCFAPIWPPKAAVNCAVFFGQFSQANHLNFGIWGGGKVFRSI